MLTFAGARILPNMSKAAEEIVHVRLNEQLRVLFDRFHGEQGYGTKSDTLRVLLTRGLFLSEKPRGRFTEAAFHAAYNNYFAHFYGIVRQRLLGPGMKALLEDAAAEVMARAGMTPVDHESFR